MTIKTYYVCDHCKKEFEVDKYKYGWIEVKIGFSIWEHKYGFCSPECAWYFTTSNRDKITNDNIKSSKDWERITHLKAD